MDSGIFWIWALTCTFLLCCVACIVFQCHLYLRPPSALHVEDGRVDASKASSNRFLYSLQWSWKLFLACLKQQINHFLKNIYWRFTWMPMYYISNKLRKWDKFEVCQAFYRFFEKCLIIPILHTGAWMLDSIYPMILNFEIACMVSRTKEVLCGAPQFLLLYALQRQFCCCWFIGVFSFVAPIVCGVLYLSLALLCNT